MAIEAVTKCDFCGPETIMTDILRPYWRKGQVFPDGQIVLLKVDADDLPHALTTVLLCGSNCAANWVRSHITALSTVEAGRG